MSQHCSPVAQDDWLAYVSQHCSPVAQDDWLEFALDVVAVFARQHVDLALVHAQLADVGLWGLGGTRPGQKRSRAARSKHGAGHGHHADPGLVHAQRRPGLAWGAVGGWDA